MIKNLKLRRNLLFFFLSCTTGSLLLDSISSEKKNPYVKEAYDRIEPEKELDSSLKADNYSDYFKSQIPKYPFEEWYPNENDMEDLLSLAETKKSCLFKYDGEIEPLVEKIRNNSIKYVEENPEYQDAFYNSNNGKQENYKNMIFELIFKETLSDIIKNSTNAIEEDLHTLQDYSIVYSDIAKSGVRGQTYPGSKLITIDYFENFKHKEFVEKLIETILHELNHEKQVSCACRIAQGQKYYTVIPAYSSFIMESSAESAIYNTENVNSKKDNTLNYTYPDYRKKETFLFMLGLFQENNTISDYYDAIFDSDIIKFYQFLGTHNNQDMLDVYRIIYSIDGIYKNNDLYKKLKKTKKDDIEDLVGHTYKVAIFNRVLADMVHYTDKHFDFRLNDNLIMLNIIRDYILEEDKSDHKDIIENIAQSSDKYLDFLSLHYGDTKQEIESKENKLQNTINHVSSDLLKISCQGNSEDVSKKAEKLMHRFPILKSIVFVESPSNRIPKKLVK